MNLLLFGGLLSTPAPTTALFGVAFVILFAIVGIMVGPDYDCMNAALLGNSNHTNQDKNL